MTPVSIHLVLDSSTRPFRGTKGSLRRSKTLSRTVDKIGSEFKCGGIAKQLPRLRPERVQSEACPQ